MSILKIILSIIPAWVAFAFVIGALRDIFEAKFLSAFKSAAIAAVAGVILYLIWM